MGGLPGRGVSLLVSGGDDTLSMTGGSGMVVEGNRVDESEGE